MADAVRVDASAAGAPWPASAVIEDRGLVLGGVPAGELADRFGTPLVVVDEDDLRARCREVRSLFPRACYAVKAFTAQAALRIVLDEGLDLLAATGGELEACLRAGAPASRIVFHGNAKTDAELAAAVEARVGLLVADGLDELRRLDRIAREARHVQPALLRVVPDVEVETHEAIATGHDASKFGTALADAVGVLRDAAGMPGPGRRGTACAHRLAAPRRRAVPAHGRHAGRARCAASGRGRAHGPNDRRGRRVRRAIRRRVASRSRAAGLRARRPARRRVRGPRARGPRPDGGAWSIPGREPRRDPLPRGLEQDGLRRPPSPRGRRRHERQRAPRALRRQVHRRGGVASPRRSFRRRGDVHRRGPPLRIRRHPRRARVAARRHRARRPAGVRRHRRLHVRAREHLQPGGTSGGRGGAGGIATPWLRREDAADLDRLEVARVRTSSARTPCPTGSWSAPPARRTRSPT